MANIKNTINKPLSVDDGEGVIVIKPGESVVIADARLKKLKKNKVIKSYFDKGFLLAVKKADNDKSDGAGADGADGNGDGDE